MTRGVSGKPIIITGGQTGVDQAAWRAAARCGLSSGGFMPAGFLTEDGLRPELARFGAEPLSTYDYAARTRANVARADATLILTTATCCSPGTDLTVASCAELGKPCLLIDLDGNADSDRLVAQIQVWLREVGPDTLNIAGPRESTAPGIGEQVEALLVRVLGDLSG